MEATKVEPWTQGVAIEWCREAEKIAPEFGYHVALTGGCLYKEGARKDLDVVFYSIRGMQQDHAALLARLVEECLIGPLGEADTSGFAIKASLGSRPIDLLFPESSGNYGGPDHPTGADDDEAF